MDEMEMTMDYDLIQNTVGRINTSLNKRFEKDAALYISITDVEELKKRLYQGKFKRINATYTVQHKYSAEVLTKIIIKNAWLIRHLKRNDFNAYFKEVFEVCDKSVWDMLINDIIKNKIDMPIDFRKQLIKIYIDKMNEEEAKAFLDAQHPVTKDSVLLKTLFIKALKDRADSAKKKVYIEDYLEVYPKLLNEGDILNQVFNEEEVEEIMNQLFEDYILKDKSKEPMTKAWQKLFLGKNRKAAFNKIMKHTCEVQMYDNVKWLFKKYVARILEHDGDNTTYYIQQIGRVYKSVSNDDVRVEILKSIPNIQEQSIREMLHQQIQRNHDYGNIGLNRLFNSISTRIRENDEEEEKLNVETLYQSITELEGDENTIMRKIKNMAFRVNKYQEEQANQLLKLFLEKVREEADEEEEEYVSVFLEVLISTYFKCASYVEVVIDHLECLEETKEKMIETLMELIELKEIYRHARRQECRNKIKEFVKNTDFNAYQRMRSRL